MKRAADVLRQALVLLAVVAIVFAALYFFRAHDSLESRMVLAVVLAVPVGLIGVSFWMRSRSDRPRSLGSRRSIAEAGGTLAIITSLVFVEAAYVSPQHVGNFLLFSWRAATLVSLCVAGMISAGFGKGRVRTTALLAGLATLGLWYALGMSP